MCTSEWHSLINGFAGILVRILEVYSVFKFVGNGTQIAQSIRKAVLVELRADGVVQACCLRHSYLSPEVSGRSSWIQNKFAPGAHWPELTAVASFD
jgi:hypothetical protein